MRKLHILMASPECVPFVKTGGLADVVGSLPKELVKLGHKVKVVLPYYKRFINPEKYNLKVYFETIGIWMGNELEWAKVWTTNIDGVDFYFIEFDLYFDREGLYHDNNFNDYYDNPERFAFLSRAAIQLAIDSFWDIDVFHVHDWQTALIPAYLKIWHWNQKPVSDSATLLTIHNIGYQGIYGPEHYDYIGLGWSNFTPDKLESYGNINFLKGGIVYSDLVNTVSPTYAKETVSSYEMSYGLKDFLEAKGENYIGILNGVDYSEWNPEIDQLIPKNYSVNDLSGKKVCKEELQKRMNLEVNPNIPIIGVVSRFVHQKGLDVLAQAIEQILKDMVVQFAILGSGDKGLEHFYGNLPAKYPGRVGSYIGYNNELAHLIEAGSDFFIMPSVYEPCGLNQIYSLKYGTLPIVRATGGLDDTVDQYDEKTGEGTGFKFYDLHFRAIYDVVGWAVSTYYDRPQHMKQMIKRAMLKDFSWKKSAKEYEKAYFKAIENKRKYDEEHSI